MLDLSFLYLSFFRIQHIISFTPENPETRHDDSLGSLALSQRLGNAPIILVTPLIQHFRARTTIFIVTFHYRIIELVGLSA